MGADPGNLSFSLVPYFESYGEPLTYCLNSFTIDGSTVEHFSIQLDPFTGLLTVPFDWFAWLPQLQFNYGSLLRIHMGALCSK